MGPRAHPGGLSHPGVSTPVTGVILANASLDIAIHDGLNIIQLVNDYTQPGISVSISGLISPALLTGDRLAAFVVGLIDGDGSLQVNH